jgi:hypothetical protein
LQPVVFVDVAVAAVIEGFVAVVRVDDVSFVSFVSVMSVMSLLVGEQATLPTISSLSAELQK